MQLIAKQRGIGLFEIISHDLLQSSSIFDFDKPAKADKYRLLAEIEQHLSQNSWSSVKNLKTHVIFDFMSKLRQMQLSNYNRPTLEGAHVSWKLWILSTSLFTHFLASLFTF